MSIINKILTFSTLAVYGPTLLYTPYGLYILSEIPLAISDKKTEYWHIGCWLSAASLPFYMGSSFAKTFLYGFNYKTAGKPFIPLTVYAAFLGIGKLTVEYRKRPRYVQDNKIRI
ncbi:hypothetical protein PPL_02286 [Heterostelium album PN500]|uniref:Uncharacterized protein n=1 Tax=Heterostelium pallidum (strain ATCC 26659 / Pp 5 / PN500) TaxID=670386 RepID=D3B1W1_HETP5|nr:hypothetical protein PPL_02286 [Heterostelium album PN500]EFA85285.1 hypothetical protein PPL_02286 [Heterostelium album PN500]|eukprot:XP_020437394.1 hypothetical protein PPL_02286 [Heterostelium album PN500]